MFSQKEWTYLNHGAFSAALKEALEAEMVNTHVLLGASRL